MKNFKILPLLIIAAFLIPSHPMPTKASLLPPPMLSNIIATSTENTLAGDIIYMIMTDRFCDGDPNNNNQEPDTYGLGEYDPNHPKMYHGGDWRGIIEHMDYIAGLGVTAIWISPVVLNQWHNPVETDPDACAGYHGYAAKNFYLTDPHFGSMEELKELVRAAHERGIKVIFDLVLNHVGDYQKPGVAEWWDSNFTPDPPFDNFDWYHHEGDIHNWDDPYERVYGDLLGLDDLAQEIRVVADELIKIGKYWVEQAGASGYRLDATKHMPRDFLERFVREVGIPCFGESWYGWPTDDFVADYHAIGHMIDIPLMFAIRNCFRDGGNTWDIHNMLMTYKDRGIDQNRLVRCIDSHDVARFAHVVGGDATWTKLALGFLFTIEGIPMVYYGTEQGFSGGGDPYNREDLWKLVPDFNQNHPIYQWIRKLSSLRRLSLPLRHGDFVVLYRDDFIYAYSRAYGEEETVVVLNLSLDTKSVDVSLRSDTRLSGTLINLLNETEIVQVSDGKIFVELGPREIKIFGKEIVQKFMYLTISTVPEGGEIIIDGVSRGFAPLTVELTEGRHVVSFGDIEGYKKPGDMIIDIHENRSIVVKYQPLENIEIENVPITVPENVCMLEIPKLHPLEKHVYSLMTEFVPIKRVTLKTKELIERAWIRFKPLKEPPRDTTPPKGLVYSYVEMVSNAEENFENILIEFCIKKSWIEDHNIMKETITLARLSNGSWEFLPTWLELEEDGEIMYVSLLREFSVYSVVGWSREMAARPEVLPTATWETGVQQNLELQKMLVERSWELEEMRSKLSNHQILSSVLCIGFLLIGVGVGWLIHRRSKR